MTGGWPRAPLSPTIGKLPIDNSFKKKGKQQQQKSRLGDVLKGTSPSLGRSSATFCTFSSVFCLCLVGESLIFVLVLMGITAVGCPSSRNEPNLGWVMCQKARFPTLPKALLLSAPFFLCVARILWGSIDICVNFRGHYGCWLYR